ncbi:MAG: serine/threonine protein kinase [Candidatus Eremiobacteraeota bacterium]|nr:serine/threonine protein kinase [Candidatus Eremiobacteraeota bacterium]
MLKRLGPFHIERELGSGSLGKVYLAQEGEAGHNVALKVFSSDIWSDQETIRSFLREAQAAFALRHRNIVEVLQDGFDEGKHYLLMELLPGGDLQERIDQKRLPEWRQSVRLVMQTCSALQFAHDNGVLHCDVKPANILLDADGQAILCGFGMAYVRDEPVERSPEYLAPEMVMREGVDGRADTFSAAAVLYELLTGINPFRNGNWSSVSRPDNVNAEIPVELSDLILRALSKQRDERPQAGIFARQLGEFLSEQSIEEMPAILEAAEPAGEEFSDEALPDVLVVEEAIDPVTAVLCTSPPEPEAKRALENLLNAAMASSLEWLADSVLAIYSRPLLAVEAANAAVKQFALDNLSACVVTGVFKLDRIWAETRPELGGLACRNMDRLYSMLVACPVGKLRTDFETARFAPDSLHFAPVEGELDLVELQDEAAPEPEPPPVAPPSLEERLGASGVRKRPTEFPEHVPSALRGQSRTMEIVKPKKPSSFNWNNLISLFLLIGFGIAGYYVWPMLQSGEVMLNGGPAKAELMLSIDNKPSEPYKAGTPVSLRVGEHTLKVSAKGFQPFQTKVTVKAKDKRKIPFKLVKPPKGKPK